MDQNIIFIEGTNSPTGVIYSDKEWDYECWKVEVETSKNSVIVRAEGIDGKNFHSWSEEFQVPKEEFESNSYVIVIESRKRGVVKFFKCSEIESM